MTDYHTLWGGDVPHEDLLQDVKRAELSEEERDKYIWGQIPESDFLTMYYPEKDACYIAVLGVPVIISRKRGPHANT